MKVIFRFVMALFAFAGFLFAISSSFFCMSWYGDEELQAFLTDDDAALVELLALLSIALCGVLLAAVMWIRWKGPKALVSCFVVAVILFSAAQLYLLGLRDSCISINAMKHGHVLLPVNHLWGR